MSSTRVLDTRVAKNVASMFFVQGANYLVPLIQTPYLVRILGVAAFGQVGFAQAIAQCCIVVVEFGFNITATRRVVVARIEDPSSIRRIFWTIVTAKLLLLVLAGLGLTAVCSISAKMFSERNLILPFFLWVIGQALLPQWYFQGTERMGPTALFSVATKLLIFPLTLWLVTTRNDAQVYALIFGAVNLFAGLAALSYAALRVGRPVAISIKEVFHSLAEGLPIFMSSVAVSLYSAANTVFLGFFASTVEVGYFVGADKMMRAALGIISPVNSALFPRMSAVGHSSQNAARMLTKKILLIETAGMATLSFAIMILAPYLVHAFLGPHFDHSIVLLRIMAPLLAIICASNVLGALTLLPMGKRREYSLIIVSSAALHALVLVCVVPVWQSLGAAAATLVTETVVTVFMAWVVGRSWRQIDRRTRKHILDSVDRPESGHAR